jgi:hypothetical protein
VDETKNKRVCHFSPDIVIYWVFGRKRDGSFVKWQWLRHKPSVNVHMCGLLQCTKKISIVKILQWSESFVHAELCYWQSRAPHKRSNAHVERAATPHITFAIGRKPFRLYNIDMGRLSSIWWVEETFFVLDDTEFSETFFVLDDIEFSYELFWLGMIDCSTDIDEPPLSLYHG